ncbi:uncharacterized protein LOC106777414 isoform X2 [Vigna radiata var. radiata]|uniref:Uncharacterized protein LOC106777414 isoform X2 n=1 Tax=Vigna radiata var. radiata TaxID=3916 RepID=A0A3Q0EHU9_VIGRR|nr:uncharacterized protein LOC106777414 isoform X2 [Vigna radiata var. radiata]
MLSILCVRTPKPNLSKHRVRYSPNYIFFAASSVALTTKSHLSLGFPYLLSFDRLFCFFFHFSPIEISFYLFTSIKSRFNLFYRLNPFRILESPPNKSSNLGLAFDFTVFRCCTTSLRAPSRATRKQRMDAIESDNACGNRSKRRRRHLLLVGDVEEGGGERAEERELQDNLEKNTSEFNKLLQIPSEERDRVACCPNRRMEEPHKQE